MVQPAYPPLPLSIFRLLSSLKRQRIFQKQVIFKTVQPSSQLRVYLLTKSQAKKNPTSLRVHPFLTAVLYLPLLLNANAILDEAKTKSLQIFLRIPDNPLQETPLLDPMWHARRLVQT
jgi:hypothetical protein